MKKFGILLFIFVLIPNVFAQKDATPKDTKEKTTVVEAKSSDFLNLAKAALAAHGGDKFKNMKTLVVKGSADVSLSPTQTIPSTFVMILSGEKYRLEIINPLNPFWQKYDGQQTTSSIPNFTLPPVNRLGLPLLQKIDDKGYVVTALAETIKKKGFRITSPEGYYTDFFIDEKTGAVKGYEASFDNNGRSVTTSVEIDKLREVDGVKIPEKYAQRFELGFATIYSDFKAKDILINSEVADDVFSAAK